MKISERLEKLAGLCHHGVDPEAFEHDLRVAAKDAAKLEARWAEEECIVRLVFDGKHFEKVGGVFAPCFLLADWQGEDLKLGDWDLEEATGEISLKISVPYLHTNGRTGGGG